MNPLNHEAGEVPAPADAADLAVVERSARVMWRAFPYFGWRFGERGRAFGRSDAGYLATLNDMGERAALAQVRWLCRVLAARGMPSLLVEYQLESLGRVANRAGRPAHARLLSLAAELRETRLRTMASEDFEACARIVRDGGAGEPHARGVGALIASAVVDKALGFGSHDEALVGWFVAAIPDRPEWARACGEAQRHALRNVRS